MGKVEVIHETFPGNIRGWGATNQIDDGIKIVQGYLEAFKDMRSFLGSIKIEFRSSYNNLFLMFNVVMNHLFEVENLGLSVNEN